MAQNKTVPDGLKVSDYLAQIEPAQRQADCQRLYDIMLELTGWTPKIWGSKLKNGIVGFGDYHYKYESGREGDSPNVAFSPRKARLVMYVMGSVGPDHPLMAKLGKHKTGKVCLYVNKLADIDLSVLEEIIRLSYQSTLKQYG